MFVSSKLAKEPQAVLTAGHKLIGNGYQIQFIKLLLVDVEDHHMIEPGLTHCAPYVALDAPHNREGTFIDSIGCWHYKDQARHGAHFTTESLCSRREAP